MKVERKRTRSRHCQKDWKGDDEPTPPVDHPEAVNLHPMVSATRDLGRFVPYHQTITKDHIGTIERLIGKVQGNGLAIEVALWTHWSPIKETLLKGAKGRSERRSSGCCDLVWGMNDRKPTGWFQPDEKRGGG